MTFFVFTHYGLSGEIEHPRKFKWGVPTAGFGSSGISRVYAEIRDQAGDTAASAASNLF